MFSIIEAYHITAWIGFFIAIQFAIFIPFLKENKKLYFYFTLMTLSAALFQHYTAAYYEAATFNEVVFAFKVQMSAGILVVLFMYLFLSEYTNAAVHRLFVLSLAVFLSIYLVINAISPYGMRFSSITHSEILTLPWGENVRHYYGDPSLFINVFRILFIAMLLWGIYRAAIHYKKNRLESFLLILFLIVFIISLVIGYLIDAKHVHFVYVVGFAYFLLVVTMMGSLILRVLKQQSELEISTFKLAQENVLRQQVEEKLLYQVEHDDLTGLANRHILLNHLEEAIHQAQHTSMKVAILLIDLDHFKGINDALGHEMGDEVLLGVAQKILGCIRITDRLARLGGDEFCVWIPSLESDEDADVVAINILKELEQPILINGVEFYITGSIGISIYPNDGNTPTELLRNADSAMYKAKQDRNSYQFYTEDMTKRSLERLGLESDLRRAIEKEEFVVYYQPQINAQTNQLIGMEALVRWEHPKRGMLPPSMYIPFAVETGFIIPIDRYVMKKGMLQLRSWYEAGLNPGVMALNLTIKLMKQDDFIPYVLDSLASTQCHPEWLEFELAESEIMDRPEEAIRILKQLHDIGIKIAIDDFGTGYSSLSYLKKLPVDKLKIDKSFIDDTPHDPEAVAVVKAIIALSQSLHLEVIAEGVEKVDQKDFLVENGCTHIQGYYYGKPMPAKEFEKFLKLEIMLHK